MMDPSRYGSPSSRSVSTEPTGFYRGTVKAVDGSTVTVQVQRLFGGAQIPNVAVAGSPLEVDDPVYVSFIEGRRGSLVAFSAAGIHHGRLEGLDEDDHTQYLLASGARAAATLTVTGSLSKGSGSFRIPHPLPELGATNDLVHSFVEAPQADNIYRGRATLTPSAGGASVSVNIDEAAGMTEGTFVLLNRDVQSFTSNEDGPCSVWSSISGNVLTIYAESEDCADTISWMVIGERQDQHMYDTGWTDEDGRVIVEPVRPEGPPGS